MRTFRVRLAAAVVGSLTVAGMQAVTAAPAAATPPTESFHIQTLWRSGTEGGTCFRLPAITKTSSGTLVAFAERRNDSCDDNAVTDIVMKRSFNDGRTWTDTEVVLGHESGAESISFATVVAHSDGPIFLFTTTQPSPTDNRPRTPKVQVSTDDGREWSEPRDLSSSIMAPSGDDDWFATGPGHGIELQRGAHQGRIVVPVTYKEDGEGEQGVRMIYSDDLGGTWTSGASVKYDMDDFHLVEPTIAEDDDANILMVARNGAVADPHASLDGLAQATSADGGESFENIAETDLDGNGFLDDDARYGDDDGDADDDPTASPVFTKSAATAPPIHPSLLRQRYGGSSYSRLLLSAPARPKTDNNAQGMFVRSSFDDGATWTAWDGAADPEGVEIDTDHAGYSDLVNTDRGIGVLYEAGEVRFRDEVRFNWFWESALGLPK